MPQHKTNLGVLNQIKPIEVILDLNSFAGGENTIGEDIALNNNEARIIENWDAISEGGMIRSKGFTEVADGGATYTTAPDLMIHHKQSSGTRLFLVIGGDLAYKNNLVITQIAAGGFTNGILCGAVSAGDKCWITNIYDNLKYTSIGGALSVPTSLPTSPRERIHYHKYRLLAEGGGRTVYGSRAGVGNWTAADAWSLANDAWSIDMPDNTKGGISISDEFLIFTQYKAYALYNFPNTSFRDINGSIGCCSPHSIAMGNEGVYFLSNYPTLGVYCYDGTNWNWLTKNHDFVNKVNLSGRVFGIYRNRNFYLIYNELGSGVSYPNIIKIFDARYGRWMSRPVNTTLADNLGFPELLRHDNNELYLASGRQDKIYEFETDSNSDAGQDTQGNYLTKDYTSLDFKMANGGGKFPIDDVRLKLIKMVIGYNGLDADISVAWNSDKGQHTGSQTLSISTTGDLVNSTFIVNTSYVVVSPSDRMKVYSFSNAAIGRKFNFQILNNGQADRPKIKYIRIHANIIDDL